MSKKEFLESLEIKLKAKVNNEETQSLVQYYDGYIDEAIDFGMGEAEVIEQLGDIDALVNDITAGLSEKNIDISTRELAIATPELSGLEMDLRNTAVELIYDDSIKNISVKVDKRYKQDYLVKTIDGVFKIKQIKSSISVGPGFTINYNRGSDDGMKGLFDLDFDFDLQLKMRKLYVRIPTHFDLETYIQTSNAKIEVNKTSGMIQTASFQLVTSNAPIILDEFKARTLKVKTSNSMIKVTDTDSEVLELETCNAKVIADNVLAKELRIKTSNSKVELEDVLFMRGRIKTSNGKICVALRDNDMSKHVYFHTSNAKVSIDGRRYETDGETKFTNTGEMLELEVQTSNGKIELENFN